MSEISIFFLDNSKNIKEEKIITKSNNYHLFLEEIKQKFKDLPIYYEIYTLDKKEKEIIIKDEESFKKLGEILFIREANKEKLKMSLFDMAYNRLSESKREILYEKFSCLICSNIIKNENPYLCYICQKIFHENCLNNWDKQCKSQNKNLVCPGCRNELALKKWKKKLDYEENRKDNFNLINKIRELKEKEKDKNEIIKIYEDYINKTIDIFKNILININSIHSLLELEYNSKLNTLIDKYPLNIYNLDLDNISKTINDELEQIKIYFQNKNKSDFNANKVMINKDNIIKKENKIKLNNFSEHENIDKNKNKDRRFNSAKKINTNTHFIPFNNHEDLKLNFDYEKRENSIKIKKNNFISLKSGKNENKKILYKNINDALNIKKFYSLIIKFEKIFITNKDIYVEKNNMIFLEIIIPNTKNNKPDILKIYHKQGSKIEDKNNIINIKKEITHKIFFDEKNITNLKQGQILIFFHVIKKKTENKKDISIDKILGYARFTLARCFLNKEKSFSGKFNIIEKGGKNNKNKNEENKYDKNGERIIGNFEIFVQLK